MRARERLLTTVLLAAAPWAPSALAQPLFDDGFEAGSTAVWSSRAGTLLPEALCSAPITAVDTSAATVVGNGSAVSCTEGALDVALAHHNGMIRFDCGPAAHTLTVTSEKVVTEDLVIDGGGTVVLSGGDSTRILAFRVPWATTPLPTLTIQNLAFVDGSTAQLDGSTPTSGGAAIYRDQGGHLRVINSVFAHNRCPASGQDVAGGAIYSFGEGTSTITGSRFFANHCSSGGALGALGVADHELTIVNSLVDDNFATGTGGNPGLGGNGGGLYVDGANQDIAICGSSISNNDANARGAGVMRVSNNGVGGMSIDRSVISGNSSPAGPDSQAGGLYLQGLQTTIVASTISDNTASHTGGIFLWTHPGSQSVDISNSTIAGNHARTGLGAGLTVATGMTGSLHHVTLARNSNEGPTSFASALAGGQNLSITNSLIADNSKVFVWENTSCNVSHAGAGNVQWPSHNAGGQSELTCATLLFDFLDPGLGALQENGGPTATIAPSTIALRRAATGCSSTDQRGQPRGATCTPGAFEMP